MKKSLLFTFAMFMFFGCSEKSVTHSESSVTHSEPKEENSVKESLAEELLMEFQDDLDSWNACIVYDNKEYTSLDDFLNKDKLNKDK